MHIPIQKKIAAIDQNQWQWLFTFVSLFVAWRVIYIQQGWINDDSVLYFEVAKLFSLGQWKEGFALYNWPLYPAIIATIHQATHIGIQQVAQIVDVLFFAITTFSYISLIRLAGGNKNTIFCGVALLFSTPYIVGDVLPMLLRDEGFWAFFLLSLTHFIQFYRNPKLQTALLWQITAIIAVLFRIEAITFLVLLPVVLLSAKRSDRIKTWMLANSLSILAFVCIFLIVLLHPTKKLADLGRLNDLVTILQRSYINITHTIVEKSHLMGEQVLGSYLNQFGLMSLILSLMAIIFYQCMTAAGWLVTIILAINWQNAQSQLTPDARKIFYWIMALVVLNTVVILTSTFVLSGRYIINLGFILLIFAAFSLANFISNPTNNRKVLLILVTVVITFNLVSNFLPKNKEYNYEQQAVTWLKTQNTTNTSVFYVSPRVRFYAGVPFISRGYDYWEYTKQAIADGSIQNYDYLVINMAVKNPDREKQLMKTLPHHHLIKEFMGFRGKKKIMIFARNKNE